MVVLNAQLPEFLILRHEDVRTSGIPDISINGLKRTSWLEVKHADPTIDLHPELQELTCRRVARKSFYCRYLVYFENGNGLKRTMLIHPDNIHSMSPDQWTVGFDHRWVAECLRKVHSSRAGA